MVERVAAVREAIGPDIELCIDLHARYDVPSACRIAWEMEPFKLLWLEEPIPAENVDALRQVRARSRTPICVGENLYLRWGFASSWSSRRPTSSCRTCRNAAGSRKARRSQISPRSTTCRSAAPGLDAPGHDGDLPRLAGSRISSSSNGMRSRSARSGTAMCRPRWIWLHRQGWHIAIPDTPGIWRRAHMENVERARGSRIRRLRVAATRGRRGQGTEGRLKAFMGKRIVFTGGSGKVGRTSFPTCCRAATRC